MTISGAERFSMLERRLNVVFTVGIACGLALIALQVQNMLSDAQL